MTSALSTATSVSAGVAHIRGLHEQFCQLQNPGCPDWLRQLRARAIDCFTSTGLPTPRQEDWKYTRVNAIEKRLFALGAVRPTASSTCAELVLEHAVCADPGYRLVFVDGVFNAELSTRIQESDGLWVRPLCEALDVVKTDLEARQRAAEKDRASGFTLLNTAFVEEGVFIHTEPDAQISSPVELLFLAGQRNDEPMSHPQIWIDAGARSSLKVVENYAGPGASAYLTNVITQVKVNEQARVQHCKIQAEGDVGYHIASLWATVAKDGQFDSLSLSLGARLARNDIGVQLTGANAHATLDGLMLARGRQHTDFHTRVDHEVADTSSDEYYKGIFDERSRGVFNGRVYVHPGADRIDAQQQNRNLLLSRNAEIDTKPQLEIYADEVKCSHGATVGQLDENMQFYLRSRGLSQELARSILIYGFAQEVVDRIEDPMLRQQAAHIVKSRLPGELETWDQELSVPHAGDPSS